MLALTACTPRATRPTADARLTLLCPVPEAGIYLDDTFVGRAADFADRPIAVGSGLRRVEVRAEGFFTAYREVSVPPHGEARLEVPLQRVPAVEPGAGP